MAKRKRNMINVDISDEMAEAVDRLAEQEMVRRTVIARRALRDYLALHVPNGLEISTIENRQHVVA